MTRRALPTVEYCLAAASEPEAQARVYAASRGAPAHAHAKPWTCHPGVNGQLFAEQTASVTLSAIPSEILSPRQVIVVDLNGDGAQDIIATNRGVPGDDDAEGLTVLINRVD